MPKKRHRIKGTIAYKIHRGKPTRFRFGALVRKRGRLYRQRLGFRGNKVLEIAFVPIRK